MKASKGKKAVKGRQGPGNRSRRGQASPKSARAGEYPTLFQPSPFTEESRRKRSKARRRRAFLGWPLRLLTLAAVLLSLLTLLLLLPQFSIESISVEGTRLIDQAEVAALVEPLKGRHFIQGIGGSLPRYFSLRYGATEERILALSPLIRQVDVRFHFPSRIRVTVEERVEVLAIRVSGGYALIDRDHCLLRLTDAIDFALPVLEGVSVLQEPEIGSILEVENPSQLLAAARVTAALIRHDQQNVEGRRLMGDIRQFRQISGRLFYLFIPLSQGGELRVKLEDYRLLQD